MLLVQGLEGKMLFKGNSSRLELLIGKIQAHKEPPSPPQDDKCHSKSKGSVDYFDLNILIF